MTTATHDRTGSGAATAILSRLLEARTGQMLSPSRRWRIEASIAPLLAETGIASLDALVGRLASTDDGELTTRVVEALLNHETSFFRDAAMFDQLAREVLPALERANAASRRLRIWSAACSTGQEAYSIAMLVLDNPKRWAGWQIDIVGTDVSGHAVARATAGCYTSFEIQRGLPVRTMLRWFDRQGDDWAADAALRRAVKFTRANLLETPPGRFDLVLCRNVLMYMPAPRKADAFEQLSAAVGPRGYLILGAGETVIGQTERFATHPAIRGTYVGVDQLPPPRRIATR